MSSARVIEGDCREVLATLAAGSVQTCVTSPPYYGLRDYGVDGQIGLGQTVVEYVEDIVGVFELVRRVLADDGTLWLNLGDSYAGAPNGGQGRNGQAANRAAAQQGVREGRGGIPEGFRRKNLLGIPWRVAFALQDAGWNLRSDIIWAKRNILPENVTDRPTKAHEYLFLLTKRPDYFYDAAAIAEPIDPDQLEHNWRYAREFEAHTARAATTGQPGNVNNVGIHSRRGGPTRNKRSVWTVSSQPFPGAHFATFPPKLIEPCILAGSRPGDEVLDPFSGAGTTGLVALRHDRDYVGIELNPEYAQMSRHRIADDAPLLNEVAA